DGREKVAGCTPRIPRRLRQKVPWETAHYENSGEQRAKLVVDVEDARSGPAGDDEAVCAAGTDAGDGQGQCADELAAAYHVLEKDHAGLVRHGASLDSLRRTWQDACGP